MEELTKVTPEDINLLRERLGDRPIVMVGSGKIGKSIGTYDGRAVGVYSSMNEPILPHHDTDILIVACDTGIGESVSRHLMMKKDMHVQPRVIHNEEWIERYILMQDGRFEVNGIWYKPIVEPKQHWRGARIEAAFATALLCAELNGSNSRKVTPSQCECDVVEEFKLIQLKKSKLSSAQRKWVVSQFNQQYVKV